MRAKQAISAAVIAIAVGGAFLLHFSREGADSPPNHMLPKSHVAMEADSALQEDIRPQLSTAVDEPAEVNHSPARDSESALSSDDQTWPARPDLARELRERKETAGQHVSPLGPEDVAARALALQPSMADMLNMDTTEVARELVFSPLQVSIFHVGASGPDQQLTELALLHPGVDILLSRPDAGAALLATYRTYSDAIADPAGDYVEIGSSGLEFATLETLLGAEAVLDQIGEAGQLPTLIETVIEAVDRQAVYDASQPEPVYGEAMRNHAATLVGRSLVRLQDPAFLDWLSAPGREGVLTERHPTYEESATILEMGAAFSSSRNVVEARE